MGKVSKNKKKSIHLVQADVSGILKYSKDFVTPQIDEGFQKPTAKITFWLLIFFILLSSSAVYFNSLFNGFAYDDAWQVLNNRWITDIRYIPDIFAKNVWGFRQDSSISNYYRPAMHLIYMANYHIFGLNPWGFHLVNILLHDGVCLLVFLISAGLFKQSRPTVSVAHLTPPFIAALLYATHPIHTEAVTWVAGLPDLSFAFFYFLSFYFYIKSTSSNILFKGTYILSIISFFLATLCKEPALTLPLIIAAYDYAFRKGKVQLTSSLKRCIPYLMVTGCYFLLRFHALKVFAPLKQHTELTTYQSFINVLPLFMHYLEKLIFPINLNVFYVLHPISSIFEMKGILSLIVTTAFVVFTFVTFRTNKVAFIALLFIVIPLLPVLYIPGVGTNTFAERYLYISSFGFVLLVALLVDWAQVNKPSIIVGLATLSIVTAGLYSWETVSRNTIWKDDYTLFADTAGKSPDADVPRYNLGLNLQNKGKIDEAIEQYQIALKINPDYADAHMNLGIAFFKKGWIDNAIEQYQIALKINPDYADAHMNLGVAFFKERWIDKAIEQYQIALKLKPDNVDAHVNLGAAFGEKKWIDKAIQQFELALQLDPDSVNAHKNLARAYELRNAANKTVHNE